MKNHCVHEVQRVWLVLLWAVLLSQTAWAQLVPDAQWARVGRTLAITADGNIATGDGGIVVKYGLNGDKLLESGLLAGTSYIGGKIQGCPSCVPNVNGYAPIGSIRYLSSTADGGVLLIGNEFSTGFTISARLNVNFSRAQSGGGTGDYVVDTPDRGVVSVSNIREYNTVTYTYTERKVAVVSRSSPQSSWSTTLSFSASNPATPDVSLTRANVLINTPDGGFLVAGYFNSSGNESPDVGWVAKLDGQGNVSWRKLLSGLPLSNSFNGPPSASIIQMRNVTDATLAADGNGYALVGTAIGPSSRGVGPTKGAILELNADGSFKRARSTEEPPTDSFITHYTDKGGKKYYAVGNSSLQNGTDPQILLIDPATLPLSDPALFTIAAKRTFEGPGDGPLTDIATAGDGGLVFVTANNQLVKLVPEKLNLYQPTYDCASGAITFNTLGGDGSPITYSAPGISRASATSNSGTVEPGLRNDPKDILITAMQNGVSTTYNFDLRATCGPPAPKSPLYYTLPDLTFVAGQEISFEFGSYFLDPTASVPNYSSDWLFTVEGLPEGLRLELRTPYNRVPYVPILGAPTTPGVYTVSVTASTSAFRNDPIRTTFQITILPNGQPPVNPPLTLTQPTYDCQTGAIRFNTTGSDGSPITYSAPGISRASATSNSGTVEQGLRGDPKPILIMATQSGQTVSYSFDFGAFCNGTQPPVTPPPGDALALLAPTYDCQSGAITFRTSGGNGSAIEYAAAGITGWTSNPNQFVDRDSRTANDVRPFTLMARQNGVTVSYVWDLRVACGQSQARLGTGEPGTQLSVLVLGNPVENKFAMVEIRGVANQMVQVDLIDLQGRVLHQHTINRAGSAERVSIPIGDSRGILLLTVSTATQRQRVKLLKP